MSPADITFKNLKWTTTLIPAHYGSGRRIQDFSEGGDSDRARYDKCDGGAVRFRSNTKSAGPSIVWHRDYYI